MSFRQQLSVTIKLSEEALSFLGDLPDEEAKHVIEIIENGSLYIKSLEAEWNGKKFVYQTEVVWSMT